MLYEIIDGVVLIRVKWKNKIKIVAVDESDFDKVKDKKISYYQYGNFVGYHVKEAVNKRVNSIASVILDTQNKVIHKTQNVFDNRRSNLVELKINLKIDDEEEVKSLISSWNELITKSSYSEEVKTNHIITEFPTLFVYKSKPAPKSKQHNFSFTVSEEIKPYLYYTPVKDTRTDYFYIVDHPLVIEKLQRRRLQGTKNKKLSTEEKYNEIIKVIESLK